MTELVVPPVLSARNLVKHFPVHGKGLLRRRIGDVHAVCGVSLDLRPGETLALVGESGCGKSTTARLLLNLIRPTAGEIRYQGRDITGLSRRRMRPLRRDLQPVFHNPSGALDPRMTAFDTIAEPFRVHRRFVYGGPETVDELMATVGLDPTLRDRYPHELSTGRRQRIGIARALALRPKVLILDEPVSALDATARAGVINLLEDLREELGLAYLLATRDLSVARHTADRVAVMYLGRIIEAGEVNTLFEAPAHPYTQALLSAIPLPDPRRERRRRRVLLTGDPPDAEDPPTGCRFRTRCPKFARELSTIRRRKCIDEVPVLKHRYSGTEVACHYAAVSTVF